MWSRNLECRMLPVAYLTCSLPCCRNVLPEWPYWTCSLPCCRNVLPEWPYSTCSLPCCRAVEMCYPSGLLDLFSAVLQKCVTGVAYLACSLPCCRNVTSGLLNLFFAVLQKRLAEILVQLAILYHGLLRSDIQVCHDYQFNWPFYTMDF